ncbi:OB-fold protein [Chitinophagaceae bacterium LWZ2-11]
MKKKIIFAVLAIGVVVGACAVWYVFFKPHRNVGAEKAKYEVASVAFSQEFKADTAAATKKYIDQAVLIEGSITNIEHTTISLDNIACNVDSTQVSKLATLKVGDKVKVQGLVVGYNDLMEEIGLAQCVIK